MNAHCETCGLELQLDARWTVERQAKHLARDGWSFALDPHGFWEMRCGLHALRKPRITSDGRMNVIPVLAFSVWEDATGSGGFSCWCGHRGTASHLPLTKFIRHAHTCAPTPGEPRLGEWRFGGTRIALLYALEGFSVRQR